MKFKFYALSVLMLVPSTFLWAQPPPDVLGENLFPPELLMRFQSELGLTEKQRDSIHEEMQKAGPRFEKMHQELQSEVEKLAALLKKERVEEKPALAQFDKVQNLEREIKRAHLALIIGLKNKLTPEQQAKLREIKKQHASDKPGSARPSELPPSIPSKMEKVKAGVAEWQSEGRDPSAIGEIMQEFEPLMKEGKFKEAEAVLDRALKVLNGQKDKSNKSK